MSEQDVNSLRTVSRTFWSQYTKYLAGLSIALVFYTSISIVATLVLIPEATLYLILALAGTAVHVAAFTLRDSWTEGNPLEDWEDVMDSGKAQFIAFSLTMIYLSFFLFAATALAWLLSTNGAPAMVAYVASAYFIVADRYLSRKVGHSPGDFFLRTILKVVVILGIVQNLSLDDVPLFDRRKRPGHFG
mgnify:FL=1